MRYFLILLVLLLFGCSPAKPADESIHLMLSDRGLLKRKTETIDYSELAKQVKKFESTGKKVEIVVSALSSQNDLLSETLSKIRSTPGLENVSIITVLVS